MKLSACSRITTTKKYSIKFETDQSLKEHLIDLSDYFDLDDPCIQSRQLIDLPICKMFKLGMIRWDRVGSVLKCTLSNASPITGYIEVIVTTYGEIK